MEPNASHGEIKDERTAKELLEAWTQSAFLGVIASHLLSLDSF